MAEEVGKAVREGRQAGWGGVQCGVAGRSGGWQCGEADQAGWLAVWGGWPGGMAGGGWIFGVKNVLE